MNLKPTLFDLLAHADEVIVDGYVIESVHDLEDGLIRLECHEDASWLVRDQPVEYDKNGYARVRACVEYCMEDDEEKLVSVTFLCKVPLPLVYPDPSSLSRQET